MTKIYLFIYVIIAIIIVVILFKILKELLDAVKMMDEGLKSADNLKRNTSEINNKLAYIVSVKEKVFTPNTKKAITGLLLISGIVSDLKNAKNRPVKYAIKKIIK